MFLRFTFVRSVLLLLFIVSSSVLTPAQDDDEISIRTRLVTLNIGVADVQGNAVGNLTANDFQVYEDGVPQKINSFESNTNPFSLVLLLDTSGSTLNFRTTLKQAAARFIDALAPDDRVCVVAFNSKPQKLTKFTTDRRKISSAINYAEGRGLTELYDAMGFALEQLAGEGKRRKAIVVLTDGKDYSIQTEDRRTAQNVTSVEDGVRLINPITNSSVRRVIDAADRQGVTIYPLAMPMYDARRDHPEPFQLAAFEAARVRLESLANRSGGRLHDINRLEDMGRLYAEVAADLRTLYTVTYQPSSSVTNTASNFRKIAVQVARPNVIARTREGYYVK